MVINTGAKQLPDRCFSGYSHIRYGDKRGTGTGAGPGFTRHAGDTVRSVRGGGKQTHTPCLAEHKRVACKLPNEYNRAPWEMTRSLMFWFSRSLHKLEVRSSSQPRISLSLLLSSVISRSHTMYSHMYILLGSYFIVFPASQS